MFSIIIPTMQKNTKVFNMLLDELVSDSIIGEIIIVDNSLKGINYHSDKIRVITPRKNLFVNPAWNLGVKHAKYDLIGILNDDLIFPKNFFSNVHNFLSNTKNVGFVGLAPIPKTKDKDFVEYPLNTTLSFEQVIDRKECWGSAIFCSKSKYFKIPEKLKVWCGDDYLFHKSMDNGLTNYAIANSNIMHLHSLTSDRKEFDKIKRKDQMYYSKINPQYQFAIKGNSFFENIFSVKNSVDKKYKIITFWGLKCKFKRYKYLYTKSKVQIDCLKKQLDYLKEHTDITKLKPATGKLRKKQLDLLLFAKEVFNELSPIKIHPFLVSGNLIGAIRHGGFIPWDDDMDFGLIRKDYEKLVEYCKKNFICKSFNETILHPITEKVACMELKEWLKEYPNQYIFVERWNMCHIIKWIDCERYNSIDFFSYDFIKDEFDFDSYQKYVNNCLSKLKLCKTNSEVLKICIKEKQNSAYLTEDSNQVYFGFDNASFYCTNNNSFIPKDVIFPLKMYKYEDCEFLGPNNSEEYLKYEGFEDFMSYPEDLGVSHHYAHSEKFIEEMLHSSEVKNA